MFTHLLQLKKPLKNLGVLAFLAIAGFVGKAAAAPMTGSYTIDNGSAASSTNFVTFKSFADSLTVNGVSGPVTVTFITDQTESSIIVFPAISGASSTNTITIDGNGKFIAVGSSTEVIQFNGGDWFTIKNLTVRNTASNTTVQGIRFTNASDNNTVDKCTIEFSALTSGSTSGGAYISFASNATSLTSSTSSFNNGINNTISNTLMRTTNSNSPGPCFAICYTGNNGNYSSVAQNNTFTNNTIQNFYYMAVYMYYTNGVQITGNDISRANSTSNNSYSSLYGIYTYYSYAANRQSKIDNNNFHDWPFAGASASGGSNYIYPIYGNYNYGNSTYRYSNSGNTFQNLNCYYVYYGIYHTYSYFSEIKNNLITKCNTYTSGNYWYGIYVAYGNDRTISGNTIQNNTCNYYTYIIYDYYSNNSSSWDYINDNVIQNNTTYGYYMYGIYAQYYFNCEMNRNRILNNACTSGYGYCYGMYTYYLYNLRCNSNLVANNNGGYGTYGMLHQSYNSGSYTADIRQNTIRIDGTKSSYTYHYGYGLYVYMYYHSKVNVIGNLVDIQGNYGAYPAYTYNTNGKNAYTWDMNTYFIKNISYQYWYNPNGGANDFNGWVGFNFAGSGELFGNQRFNNVAANDFRSNWLKNQNNVQTVSTNLYDAFSTLRNPIKCDRGAVKNILDIQLVSSTFTTPSLVCAGFTSTPVVTLQNNFIDTVYDFKLGYAINGVVKGSVTVTNKILSTQSGNVSLPTITFSNAGPNKFQIFMLDADDITSNDTLTYTFTVTPSPGGSTLSQKAGSKGLFNYKNLESDVLPFDEILQYNMSSPRKYTDAQYGTTPSTPTWYVNVWAKDPANNTIPSVDFTYSHASGTSVMVLNPSDKYVDKILTLYIQVVDNANGCDTVIKRPVFIAPKGKPNFVTPSLICDGTDVFLDNTSTVSSGALLHTWDFGDGSPMNDATSPVHKFPTYGQYDVKLTTITEPYGFTKDTTIKVTINEIPQADFARTNACEGLPVKFTNLTTIGSGAPTYEWNFGDGSPVSTTNSPSKLYTTPGGYTVTLKATANGCVSTISKNVYEFAKPKPGFAFTSNNSCDNEVFSFVNTSTIALGAFGSRWDFNDGNNISNETDPSYDFMTPGTKNVKLKAISEFGCTDSVIKTINVKAAPKSDFNYSAACSIDPTQFTNNTTIPGTEVPAYTWDFGDGTPTSSTPNPLHPWAVPGVKMVTLKTTLTGNGCKDQISKMVTVGVQPDVDFIAEDQCAGNDVIFQNSTTWAQGDIAYEWDFGNGAIETASDPVYKYSTSTSQTYNVKLKATIAGGCQDSLVKTVTINAAPATCDFDIVYDGTAGHRNYKLVPKGGSSSGINYTWLTGDGASPTSSNGGTNHDYAADGKYVVKMTAKNANGCECTQTKVLSIAWQDVKDINAFDKAVTVFPNPNNGKFNVKVDGMVNSVKVNVYNLLGEVVKTQYADSNSFEMDMTSFANGMYLVKIYSGDNVVTKKVTINR